MPENSHLNTDSAPDRFADLLDSRFRIPGTNIRFGLDPVIGLIPGLGDWLGGAASLYFMIYASVLQAPASVLMRMLMNILIDIIIGTVPLIGEIFDIGWKANLRNAKLLEELIKSPEQAVNRSKIVVWTVCIFSVALVFALLYGIGRMMIRLTEVLL